MLERWALWKPWLCAACALVAACGSSDAYKDELLNNRWQPSDGAGQGGSGGSMSSDAGTDGEAPQAQAKCTPSSTSELLPAREAALALGGASEQAPRGLFTADLYGSFVDNCGSCHARLAAQGGLNVSLTNFPMLIGSNALMRIRSEDPAFHMPPPPLGKPFSERSPDDPIVKFSNLLEQWIAAGRPADVFYPRVEEGNDGASPYMLSKDVGMQMTNLGNCVPEPAMVGTEHDKSDELDAKFSAMKSNADLPKSLPETDLFTLDSATLAQYGVVAFAPAYTLWADYAKKIRMIRVPRGKSVRFDPKTQTFDIPANTRIYKTFLKKVIDYDGNERWRKIETRIIVSRPDDGDEHTALFGTYKWNDEETEAILQQVPYRDGTGVADDVFTYVQNEKAEDEVLRQAPADLAGALSAAGATRSYAIPGSDRCVHCHMGSPQKNFILGFLPLQLKRRPVGEGGVIEEAGRDELNQVQRLISYGVITGMSSPDEIVTLEDTQADRKPRNEHELKAQGYMLGNCAHCHNPRGFPSRREPVLADVLNFMPSAVGGIFQFPLDKTSPRIFRGQSQRVPAPYVTPSLYDLPKFVLFPGLGSDRSSSNAGYIDKWLLQAEPSGAYPAKAHTIQQALNRSGTPREYQFADALQAGRALLAPWRSLIYRNVDGPFSYQDGNTVFPHMPMDTPGFDCRARQLLGTWMTSIPARWKAEPSADEVRKGSVVYEGLEIMDGDPIPYEEVLPGAPDYDVALQEAKARIELFEESPRTTHCPDPALDILAPEVSRGERTSPPGEVTLLYGEDGVTPIEAFIEPRLPGRPHYFKTDLHDDPSWAIRRSDWYEVLVENGIDVTKPASNTSAKLESADTLAVLENVVLDDAFKSFALTPVPFGLWKEKPECAEKFDSAGIRTVAGLPAAERPRWMTYAKAPQDAHVFEIAPGPQVFSAVCSKCHGPLANGQSGLAATIADLSGGVSRVANLRDGLFGPVNDPGANRQDITKFGRAESIDGLSVDQWAARYVAWMGMSGTNATIPSAVITQIGAAVVLGQAREANIMAVQDETAAANMLSAVKAACQLILTPTAKHVDLDLTEGFLQLEAEGYATRTQTLEGLGLIYVNGDGELWRRLCNYNNPGPVRVFTNSASSRSGLDIFNVYDEALDYNDALYHRDAYPADAPVGFGSQITTGISADNAFPWCVEEPDDARFAEIEQNAGRSLPRCPAALFARDDTGRPTAALSAQDANRWALRGAANAGLAVFAYLDAVAKGDVARVPAYDQCEQLSGSP